MGRPADNDPRWPEIRRLFESGVTLKDLVSQFGKTQNQIRYRAKKEKWSRGLRPRQGGDPNPDNESKGPQSVSSNVVAFPNGTGDDLADQLIEDWHRRRETDLELLDDLQKDVERYKQMKRREVELIYPFRALVGATEKIIEMRRRIFAEDISKALAVANSGHDRTPQERLDIVKRVLQGDI